MINWDEYTKTVEKYEKELALSMTEDSIDYDEIYKNPIYDQLTEYQNQFLNELLSEIRKQCAEEPGDVLLALLDAITYIRDYSWTGNVNVFVRSQNHAQRVRERMFDIAGEALLDEAEVFKDGDNWCISFMFGGYWVPGWDELPRTLENIRARNQTE